MRDKPRPENPGRPAEAVPPTTVANVEVDIAGANQFSISEMSAYRILNRKK